MTDILLRCGLCNRPEVDHKGTAHKFDPAGNLIPVASEPPTPKVVSGIDIPLRLLLLDKGIISAEELTVKEMQIREQLIQGPRASKREAGS